MTKARNLSLLSTVEAGATTDQTKADIDSLGINRGRKNLIINGGMNVAQRATSATLTSGLVFCVDRFKHTANTGGAGTASQQAFTVGQTDVPNATYYLRHNQTTGASAAPSIRQYIEDVNTYQGETVVLSYYAKVGSGTLTVTPQIQQNFGSGGSTSASVNPSPTTHTITTSWQKFTCTFSLPSVSGKTIGASSHLRVLLQFPTSTTFTFDITNVQLELGSVATDFEHRSYGEELLLCQRYYNEVPLTGVDGGYGNKGGNASAYSFNSTGTFAVKMRTTPSTVVSGGTLDGCSAFSVNVTKDGYITRVAPSGTGAYRAFEQKITFSAEL